MPELKLEDLFSAIGGAMYQAQQAVKENELNGYWRYFEPAKVSNAQVSNEDNAAAENAQTDAVMPIMRQIVIPSPDGKGSLREMQVPVVSLVNHNAFNLEQVKVRMRVTASVDENSGDLMVGIGPLRRKTDDEDGSPANSAGTEQEIELVFKREEASEGIARITQEATKLL